MIQVTSSKPYTTEYGTGNTHNDVLKRTMQWFNISEIDIINIQIMKVEEGYIIYIFHRC
mgnify:FL=1